MAQAPPTCVNHPREATRVSCSACGAPICPRCMRPSAVGQKCPDCARAPRSARTLGKPLHYVRAIGAGLPAAIVGGLVLVEVIAIVRFGLIILSALLGFVIGRVVAWGAKGQTQPPFPAVAVGCAVGGIAIGIALRVPLAAFAGPNGLWFALALAAAGWFAVRGLRR